MVLEKQKHWLEQIKSVSETPIYLARNVRQGNKFRPSYQRIFGELNPPVDHRTICANEVVIELDAMSFAQNKNYADKILSYCKQANIPVYVFWSGNKSIHIHVFLEINITKPESIEILKKSAGCNLYREVRLKFAREIVAQAGLSLELIGNGKIVDLQKLNWNDLDGKQTLIRCCGGANKRVDRNDPNVIKGGYKTWLKELPKIKPKDNSFDEVEYPDSITTYKLDEQFVVDIASEFIFNNEKRKVEIDFEYDKQYFNLPCIKQILEGLDPGQRNRGAFLLALAAKLEGLPLEKAEELVQSFCKNCAQVPTTFDFEEAKGWVGWIYRQPNHFWNCANCQRIGVCDSTDCDYHREKYKKEFQLFEENEPLAVVKEALDKLIVGEDNLKMILFLIYLTKDMNPEWCVILDGPTSSGKSHVMKNVAQLFGTENEAFFIYSRMTQAVLNHAEEIIDEWRGKVVIIEELQGASQVVEQLRVLISEGKLTLLETVDVKKPDGTVQKTGQQKVIKVDCLFVTCNAEDSDEGDQLQSRAWIINTDSSKKQTEKIVERTGVQFELRKEDLIDLDEIRSALALLPTFDEICFPWGIELKRFIDLNSTRARRDMKKFITLIKSIARLHHNARIKFRTKDNRKILYADWRDVFLAVIYGGDILFASSQGVGTKDLEYYETIVQQLTHVGFGTEFNLSDVGSWCGISYTAARKTMANLMRAGFFVNREKPPKEAKFLKTKLNPSQHVGNHNSFFEKKLPGQIDALINEIQGHELADGELERIKKEAEDGKYD